MRWNLALRHLLEEHPGSPCQGQGIATGPRRGGVRTSPGSAGPVTRRGRPTLLPAHLPPAGVGPFPAVTGWRVGLSAVAGWLGVPVLPTRYTHPFPTRLYPYPGPTTPSHTELMHHTTVPGTTGTCTYGCFWEAVGEPRGSRTHTVFRVPYGFMDLRLVCTAV